MPKRGENIHKRKDGRWEGRYKKGVNNQGKTAYSSVYGKTYGEVKSKLMKILQDEILEVTAIGRDRYFKEVILLWKKANSIKHKGATEAKYDYLIDKHILPELGEYKVSNLTTFVLNDFMNQKMQCGRLDQQGGLSNSYVRSIMLIITSALQFAVNERMCQPLRTPIYKPANEKKELAILSVSDQLRYESMLMKQYDTTNLGILLSLHTGLRIGEVCALMWDDIDMESKVIYVRSTITRVKKAGAEGTATKLILDKPKTKMSLRVIPIPSRLVDYLEHMSQQATTKYVVSDKNTFISPRTYEYRYHRSLAQCGMPSINYHALRHTFATRCIEVGVDVKTLSEVLGHANVSITLNTYVHSSMELKRAQIEKLSLLSG